MSPHLAQTLALISLAALALALLPYGDCKRHAAMTTTRARSSTHRTAGDGMASSDAMDAIGAHRARLNEQFAFPQLRPRAHDAVKAVKALIARRFPQLEDAFTLETVDSTSDYRDVLELDVDTSTEPPRPLLRGSSGVALASALHWYLHEYAHVQLSWSGDQISLPSPLPLPTRARREKPVRFTYNYNVCTVSYSTVWWSFERWQRELDWMALHGVNLVLAFTGQEYVWHEMFVKRFNFSSAELNDFFTGPAFLAWGRMGNIRAWAGPLDAGFMLEQYQLQLQLLDAMHEIGIVPVLPAFAGFVPNALLTHFPDADVVHADNWGDFPPEDCCVLQLQPTDPLHAAIGKAFLETQTALYGTDHIYNCDMFNEMNPTSTDPAYVRNTSASVFAEMRAIDADAVWLLQGWFLYEDADYWTAPLTQAWFEGVPDDGMIVLDLYADKSAVWKQTQSFYGKPFIWCTLHNFGGTLGLDASLWEIINAVPATLADSRATMIGVGLTMEGINQNYAVYELTLDLGFAAPGKAWDVFEWMRNYTWHRYGPRAPESAQQAWADIVRTVYNNTNLDMSVTRSVIEMKPSLAAVQSGFMPTKLFYDPAVLEPIWGRLLDAADALGHLPTYQYDLIDVGRQVLSNRFLALYQQLIANYSAGPSPTTVAAVDTCAAAMLDLIADTDRLLASHSSCLLGPWIADARAIAAVNASNYANAREQAAAADQYEFNARNQVTLWGPNGEVGDYAGKAWSGLYSTYYAPRWSIFLQAMHAAMAPGGAPFNYTLVAQRLLAFGQQWQHDTAQLFPVFPLGNAVDISRQLYATYVQGQGHEFKHANDHKHAARGHRARAHPRVRPAAAAAGAAVATSQ